MKRIYLGLLFFINILYHGYSQIICPAPDSVIAAYKEDADRLALRKIFRLNLPYEDSVEIPQIISDSFLNAMLAVYNAVELPERDTVVSMLDIHTVPTTFIDRVLVAADSNLYWMQLLKQNIIPTGYAPLDSLILKYDLSVEDYETWSNWFLWHAVTLKSTRNLNIKALADAFEQLDDVYFSEERIIP